MIAQLIFGKFLAWVNIPTLSLSNKPLLVEFHYVSWKIEAILVFHVTSNNGISNTERFRPYLWWNLFLVSPKFIQGFPIDLSSRNTLYIYMIAFFCRYLFRFIRFLNLYRYELLKFMRKTKTRLIPHVQQVEHEQQ